MHLKSGIALKSGDEVFYRGLSWTVKENLKDVTSAVIECDGKSQTVTYKQLVSSRRVNPTCCLLCQPARPLRNMQDFNWHNEQIHGILAFLLFLCFSVATCWASGPDLIHFQGRLTDSVGRPVVGNENRVKFSIYTSSTAAISLWNGGEQTVITNSAGLFSTDIGPVPSDIFYVDNLYLQISVLSAGSFRELLPRQRLTMVPYALHAKEADRSFETAHARAGAVDTDALLDGSVTAAKLSSAAVQSMIPSGLIAMFEERCPPYWHQFTEMNGRFPIGPGGVLNKELGEHEDVYTHSHTLETNEAGRQSMWLYRTFSQNFLVTIATEAQHVPPYYSVLFCAKD